MQLFPAHEVGPLSHELHSRPGSQKLLICQNGKALKGASHIALNDVIDEDGTQTTELHILDAKEADKITAAAADAEALELELVEAGKVTPKTATEAKAMEKSMAKKMGAAKPEGADAKPAAAAEA